MLRLPDADAVLDGALLALRDALRRALTDGEEVAEAAAEYVKDVDRASIRRAGVANTGHCNTDSHTSSGSARLARMARLTAKREARVSVWAQNSPRRDCEN